VVTNWRQEPSLPRLPKRVAVTGALGGIGRSTVALLEELGTAVHAIDLPASDDITSASSYQRCDISDVGAVATMVDGWTSEELPHALVNLAGIVEPGPLASQKPQGIQRVFETNLFGQIYLSQHLIKRWVNAGIPGVLVFVSSWVQDVPWPGIGTYSASKAALRSIARTFAREHARDGIRCNVLAPGIVGVGMARKQWDTELDYRARAKRAIPLGELQTPESVAEAIVFLCSSWSSYMTGATLLVDGGASLYPMDDDEVSS
jgi:NAD(P)-dependent dehydrogenase (short-subunit alcohol dehydrogenase family)